MATLDNMMNFIADGIGAEETSISPNIGTGSLYIKKDKISRTIRGFGFVNHTSNISTSTVLFELPEGWRPYKNENACIIYSTSNNLLALYRGSIGTDGKMYQSAGSTIQHVFVSFEYPYTQ